jgi:hypothetical protein
MKNQNTMLIEANFDVAQVSPMLECRFTRTDSDGKLVEGKNAGSVEFKQGEEVSIQVNAGGDQLLGAPRPFVNFRVVDCTLTTRPRVYRCSPNEKKVVYAPPSLFALIDNPNQDPIVVKGATVVVPAEDFEEAPVGVVPPAYYRQGRAWKGKLIVGQVKARWRLTLMVTVEIDYADNAVPEQRVYEIDPETEVGNGTGGLEEEDAPLAMACLGDPETEVGNGTGRT